MKKNMVLLELSRVRILAKPIVTIEVYCCLSISRDEAIGSGDGDDQFGALC